jgi:hypothetical protein|tara:strand:+ start:512 stop:1099 length:588 start_codon:yes stop_codon:yes gene_type:complete
MSFRKEIKLILNKRKSLDFKKMIFSRGAIEMYPKRKISSLYFDNFKKQSHIDSEEGVTPRKKIRIRTYPNAENKKYLFESKISSTEGRYKVSKKISLEIYNKMISQGYFDKMYGKLKPLIHVDYFREYYLLQNFRITIDENISYKIFKKEKYKKDTKSVIEIKFDKRQNEDFIVNSFSNKLTRFSKYSNGINLMN